MLSAGVFAACGSDKKDDASSGATATTAASTGTEILLTAKNTTFDVATLTASAGKKVTFTLKNQDSIEHNLTIEKLNVNKDVEGGESGSATATPAAGTYEYHCEYHPTQMKGTLTVS